MTADAVEQATLFRGPTGWLAYTRAGSGPPVVLIHGLGCSRRTWRHVASRLAQTRTVIAIDLPGHGESDSPLGDYSPAGQATAVRDLVESLDMPQIDVVGHSLGGGIAISFAHQYPERTRSLVLISTAGLGPEVTPLLRVAAVPGADRAIGALVRLPDRVLRAGLGAMTWVPGLVSPHDTDPLQDTIATLGDEISRRTFVRTARTVIDMQGQSISAGEQLDRLTERPVMLIWGADDRTIPPRHFRELAARFPRARQLEVPSAGHFPHETAADVVAPALEEFLLCPS